VLPADARLRTAGDFAAVVKGGRRAGTKRLVVHVLATQQQVPARAGFVVSAKVGNSVVRHRVTRRLRPLVRGELSSLPNGTALVIRALPSAATATSVELASDLRSGLVAAMRKATHPRSRDSVVGPKMVRNVHGRSTAQASSVTRSPKVTGDGGSA